MVRCPSFLQHHDAVTYCYNEAGNLASVTDSKTGLTTNFAYDPMGRLISRYQTGANMNQSMSFGYDALGRVEKVREYYTAGTGKTTTYSYDSKSRVSKVTDGTTSELYAYDTFDRLDNSDTYHGETCILTKSAGYEMLDDRKTSHRLISWAYTALGGHSNTYNFDYDENGNIVEIQENGYTTSYVYDTANQLIRENNQRAGKTWTWEYDEGGNITCKKEYAYTTGELGEVLDTITYTYDNTGTWGDILTSFDGRVTVYDSVGNMLGDSTWSYTWKQGRQLAAMRGRDITWDFSYNSDGLRIGRTNGTDTYAYWYDGDGKLLRMKYNDIVMSFSYSASGQPMSVTYDGTVYYYFLNAQGDVEGLIDSNGTVVAHYVYDAWGRLIRSTGTARETLGLHNPLRYRGYIYDHETGLYYLQSRYYNPTWGRFINADNYPATGQGILGNNMFAYCGNNPVARADFNGYFWDTVFDVFSLCVSIVDVISNPSDITAWIGLAGDAIDLIPFVSGVGELSRAANTTLDVIDSAHDASRMIDNTGDIIDTAGDVTRRTDFFITPNGEAIPATLTGFNNNLSKLDYQNGKYVGIDSNGPIRIRPNEIHPNDPNFTGSSNPLHTLPHFHIDRRANGTTGKWGKTFTGPMEMFY